MMHARPDLIGVRAALSPEMIVTHAATVHTQLCLKKSMIFGGESSEAFWDSVAFGCNTITACSKCALG